MEQPNIWNQNEQKAEKKLDESICAENARLRAKVTAMEAFIKSKGYVFKG